MPADDERTWQEEASALLCFFSPSTDLARLYNEPDGKVINKLIQLVVMGLVFWFNKRSVAEKPWCRGLFGRYVLRFFPFALLCWITCGPFVLEGAALVDAATNALTYGKVKAVFQELSLIHI